MSQDLKQKRKKWEWMWGEGSPGKMEMSLVKGRGRKGRCVCNEWTCPDGKEGHSEIRGRVSALQRAWKMGLGVQGMLGLTGHKDHLV